MIIPVVITAIVLFPFLLYIIFPSSDLIPYKIDLHSLKEEASAQPPNTDPQAGTTDPTGNGIPLPTGPDQPPQPVLTEEEAERHEQQQQELREIIHPFLDYWGAMFGGILMAITLVTLLATNAAGLHPGVWTMTVPAGAIMFFRDMIYDWVGRVETRRIAKQNREKKALKIRRREEQLAAAASGGNWTGGPDSTGESALGLSMEDDSEQHHDDYHPGHSRQDDAAREEREEALEEIEDQLVDNPHPLARRVSHESFEMSGHRGSPEHLSDPPLHPRQPDAEGGDHHAAEPLAPPSSGSCIKPRHLPFPISPTASPTGPSERSCDSKRKWERQWEQQWEWEYGW